MKRKHYIAHQVYVGSGGVEVDGVHLPWHVGADIDVEDLGRGNLWGLNMTLFAERIILNTPNGEQWDSDKAWAQQEAVRIVREGLADILAWLGEPLEAKA